MDTRHLFFHSPGDGHLSCFCSLDIVRCCKCSRVSTHLVLSERRQDTRRHTACDDSIYVQHPGQVNPQRQKADQWLPGSGERRKAGVTA